MATHAGSPQIAVRARGSKNCSSHYGNEVVFYCKTCDKLSCADCAIQECQGHLFEGISNIVPTAKQKLHNFIHKLEVTEIPHMKGKIQDVDSTVLRTKEEYKKIITSIKQQNETLKRELDKIADTWVKTCQGMEQQSLDELHSQKKALQARVDELSCQLSDFKTTLQSGPDILVFDTSRMIHSEFDDLPTPIFRTVEFNPSNIQFNEIEQLMGEINISAQNPSTLSLHQPGSIKVMSEFSPYSEHRVKSIHASVGDLAWLNFNSNNNRSVEKMLLTDQSGQVKQTLDMAVRVYAFCVSPHTGNIWFCSHQDKSVREVKESKSTIRFKTDKKPQCICVTKDDHLIIGHNECVVKYTKEGRVICRTSGDPPAVRSPHNLSECPLTSNIAVVDKDRKEEGGNASSFISILNDQLHPLYAYKGEVQVLQPPITPFRPQDVRYTDEGEIVITAKGNKSMLLVTRTGRHITTLYTHSKSPPAAVCLQNGVIWISFYNGTVQTLNYT